MYDVVIAGGGPVGLFLACELALADVSVLVLEQMEDTRTLLKEGFMGGRALHLPSVEAFYRRGLLGEVRGCALGWMNADVKQGLDIPKGDGAKASPVPHRFAGHFAGITLDPAKIDFSNQKFKTGGPSASGGVISLQGLEGLLAERLKALGGELRTGAGVTDFIEAKDGVTVVAGDEEIKARWLVGCDGGRSTVRKRAGFAFEGTDPEFTGYTAMVEIADPEKLRPNWNLTTNGMYINGPAPGRIGVVEFDGGAADRTRAMTVEDLQAALRRVSGTDVTLNAMRVGTCFTDNCRQATTYRKGRVLLAGDAAHVHSPLGGQGLNLGIGDAMNLGWKLAATVKGWAPEGLLDSYTGERHPIGAWALEWTRAQVAIMRPEPHARAIATVVRELIDTPGGTTYFAEKISGLKLHYELDGDHAFVGRSAPDLEFEDGTRLGELMHDGRGLLLELNGSEGLRGLNSGLEGRLKYVPARAKETLGLSALLVRPDGFVAWAAEREADATEAASVVARWFGKAVEDRAVLE